METCDLRIWEMRAMRAPQEETSVKTSESRWEGKEDRDE